MTAVNAAPLAQVPGEYLITDYGAKGDAKFDNAPIINGLLSKMPPVGGVIEIPDGEFLINSPLLVTSNNVTLLGVNRGWRSNVDVPAAGVSRLGGGSKLIVGPASACGILVPHREPSATGQTDRETGVSIQDLDICGSGSSAGQDGIDVEQAGDGLVIDNISCIDLTVGVVVKSADASRISNSLIAECRTSLSVEQSIQTMVTNCDLGAQPRGVTAQFIGDNQFIMSGCDIFPDGASAIRLSQSEYGTITGCLISGWYTGLIDIDGDRNTVVADTISAINAGAIWPRDPLGRDGTWGLIRINGTDNSVVSCAINSVQPDNSTWIRCIAGEGTTLSNLSMSGSTSSRKVVVENSAMNTKVLNCAMASEIQIARNTSASIEPIPPITLQQ